MSEDGDRDMYAEASEEEEASRVGIDSLISYPNPETKKPTHKNGIQTKFSNRADNKFL